MFRPKSRRPAAVRPLAAEPLEPRTMLRAYVVDTAADVPQNQINNGTVVPDGKVSLREAIEAINRQEQVGDAPAGDGDDRIYFAASTHRNGVVVGQTPLSIERGMAIYGPAGRLPLRGSGMRTLFDVTATEPVKIARLKIDGNHGGIHKLADLHAGADVQFEGLLTNGSLSAPAFTADRATLSITNSAFDGGAFDDSGIMEVAIESTGGTVRLVNTRAWQRPPREDGFRYSPAPTISADGGRVVLVDSDLRFGSTAVASQNADTLIRRTTLIGHSRSAVRTEGGRLTVQASRLSDNAGWQGGAIMAETSRVRVEYSNLFDNRAGDGGAIYLEEANLKMTGSRLGSNSASDTGGALAIWHGGRATLDGVRFSDNTARRDGGAIWSLGGFTAHDLRLDRNSAGDDGGAVYSDYGSVRITGASFVRGNTAADHAGLYFRSGSAVLDGVTIGGPRDGDGNVASGIGGGLSLRHCGCGPSGPDPVVTARGLRVVGNSAAAGAGVSAIIGTLNLTDSVVSDNTASHAGGGIYAERGTVRAAGLTLTGNTAGQGDEDRQIFWTPEVLMSGGAMAAVRSNVVLRDTRVSGNSAAFGGGLSVRMSDAFLERVTVVDNIAAFDGGGLRAVDAETTVRSSAITGNTAGRSGGGVLQDFVTAVDQYDFPLPNVLRLDRITLRDNEATNGGGLWTEASATLTASRVEDNTATGDGGGLLSDGGELRVGRGTRLTGNVAGGRGGGVFAGGGTITLDAAQVGGEGGLGNRAARGGGVFAADATTRIAGSRVLNNTADADGGGMAVSGGTAAVADSRIASNVAQHGGGLSVADRAEVRLSSTVEGNVAVRFGGGLHVSAGGTLLARGAAVRHNIARVGGGLHVGGPDSPSGPGVVRFLRGESAVTGNLASERAGGVSLHGEMTLRDVRLAGNTSSEDDDLFAGIDAALRDLRV